MVFNGKPTREWFSREDTSSTTASLQAIVLTAIINAYEGQDIMVLDVTNTFIQTNMTPNKDGEEKVIMKITDAIVKASRTGQ